MRKTSSTALLIISLFIMSGTPAFAYLDPGTASMALQALIGGIAAGAAVISLNYQRLKYEIRKRLGKDRKSDK